MDSILTSTKKLIGIHEDDTTFDIDVMIHINTALSFLCQFGVGPAAGFRIHDATATWIDFLGNDPKLDSAKDYVYLKTKLIFDPPASAAAIQSMENMIDEIEWRLTHAAESET